MNQDKQELSINNQGWIIDTQSQLEIVARKILDSGITSIRNPLQIAMIIMRGRALGMDIWDALENIYVIQNKTVPSTNLAMALVERSQLIVDKDHKFDGKGMDRKCTVTIQRKGRGKKTWSFSMKEAEEAGLLSKDSWRKWPDSMLYARALMFALRREFPDVLHGMHSAEELDQFVEEEPIVETQVPSPNGKPLVEVFAKEVPKQQEPYIMDVQSEPPPEHINNHLVSKAAEEGLSPSDLLKILYELRITRGTDLNEIPEAKAEAIVKNWRIVQAHADRMFPARSKP